MRDIVPLRPLTRIEALAAAERQARLLLKLSGIDHPPVPESVITELTKIRVERVHPFPASAATHWTAGTWIIVVNSGEVPTRQRFSLAHELKHIVDHPFVDRLYGALEGDERRRWVEQVCDYFAGCLLMPRTWLQRDIDSGLGDVGDLVRRYQVSWAAMNYRLTQIGMKPPDPRCLSGSRSYRRDSPSTSTPRKRRQTAKVGSAR